MTPHEPKAMIRTIIDCDPGIDDAIALLLAAGSSELDLVAVTTVFGNRPLETTSHNACRILDLAGRSDVPVYSGCKHPIGGTQPLCNLVHGENGLGDFALPLNSLPGEMHAVTWLVDTLLQMPAGELTLVAVGPLTNLASAEMNHPGILAHAKSLLVMGGAVFHAGNITPHAEFNIYADPLAAQVVMNAGINVMLFGLDVTSKAVMSDAWIASLATLGNRAGAAAHAMLRGHKSRAPRLHDACPIGYLLDPTLFSGDRCTVSVVTDDGPEQGRTVAGRTPPHDGSPAKNNATVFTDMDCDRLMKLVRDKIALLP